MSFSNSVFISCHDIATVKAFAKHVKAHMDPICDELGLDKPDLRSLLDQVAKNLGYSNYQDLEKRSGSVMLFTDIHLYLFFITPSLVATVLGSVLAQEPHLTVAQLSEQINRSFYSQDVDRFFVDTHFSGVKEVAHALLVPFKAEHYTKILFSSYLELVQKLEEYRQMGREVFEPVVQLREEIANQAKTLEAPIRSDLPIYQYLSKLIPQGSLFVVNDNDKVLGYPSIHSSDLGNSNLLADMFWLVSRVFMYPSSYNYRPVVDGKQEKVGLESINLDTESEIYIPYKSEIAKWFEREREAAISAEALFLNPYSRGEIDSTKSYLENTELLLRKYFVGMLMQLQ